MTLAGDYDRALQLLEELYSLQNGPPLWREKEKWEKVMEEIREFLDGKITID